MKFRSLLALATLLISAACTLRPSPVQPAPPEPTPVVVEPTVPPPAPVPPVPQSPLPEVPPLPPPEPPKPNVTYYDAVVEHVFWFGNPPLFDKTFIVEVWPDRGEVWMHNSRFFIRTAIEHIDQSIFAVDVPTGMSYSKSVNITFNKSGIIRWGVNGSGVTATGTMTRRENY